MDSMSAANGNHSTRWQAAALAIAVVGVAGSLYLSIGMGLKACPLCFYQRSFLMAVVCVLLVGWPMNLRPSGALCALALPLATSGLGVALFHVYLELVGKLECPHGMLNFGTAPQQSLALFVVLISALLGSSWVERENLQSTVWIVPGAILLGALVAAASIWSAPPMPVAPAQPYTEPLTICRPPYVIN
jgi:disulfide bond formation protein DsbB